MSVQHSIQKLSLQKINLILKYNVFDACFQVDLQLKMRLVILERFEWETYEYYKNFIINFETFEINQLVIFSYHLQKTPG